MDKHNLYEWGTLHASIFSAYVVKMNEVAIPYFILRNYEGLPEVNTSKDIDIIIEPGKYRKALNLLLEVFKSHGLSNYYIMDFERAHCVFGMNCEKDFAIHIDLIEGYANKGYEILSFEYMYSNCIDYKNFKVLDTHLDAVVLILYKIIGCKELKDKYRTTIKNAYRTSSDKIDSCLKEVLGDKLGALVAKHIKNNDFEAIIGLSQQINKSAKRIAFAKRPFKTIGGKIKFLSEKAWRMIWCPRSVQKTIAVEAPDGTGKTTFIDNLVLYIAHYFVSDISKSEVYHFRPSILPNLGAAGEKAGVMKQDKNFTVPHRAKPVGFVSSFIRMTYYWIDYVIGMPWIVRKDAQFDHITIFDRYIYDFLVDPFRARIKLPYWIRRTFARLVKQPKLVFVLDADAETIYKRKQELEPAEIERQLTEFRKLKSLGSQVHLLDATRTPDEIANEAIKIVIDKFTKKI